MLQTLATGAAAILLVPGLLTSTHLGLLAGASLRFRERLPKGDVPPIRFLVVIPAYNEEQMLGKTLRAINAARRARDQVLVVDDRSDDRTSEIARDHGALVLRRNPGEEPGRAAARQAAVEYSTALEWDAMVMIDADSIVEPGFFDLCERMCATGSEVFQARSEAQQGDSLLDQVALASFALQGVTIPRGRAALRLPVRLRGTGMIMRRSIVRRMSFHAKAGEDLQASLDLLRDGIRPGHLDAARLRSANAGSWGTATTQKLRYESGRSAAARTYVPVLLRTRTWAGVEAAWFLLSPPFATAAGLLGVGAALALAAGAVPLALAGAVGAALLAFSLSVGAVQARLDRRFLLALLAAPGYVAWKLVVQLRAFVGLRRGLREFGPTARS